MVLEQKRNIVWLASYPKSGNTWLRIFLCNLLNDSNDPIDINDLFEIPIASNRRVFDKNLGVNSSDLTHEEINKYRPEVFRTISTNSNDDVYLKVHDAWELNIDGYPVFPTEITKGVIYIIRNPLEVAVSYAYHSGSDFSTSISLLNNDSFGLCTKEDRLYGQLPQNLLSWSNHVLSWNKKSNLPIHIIRFEDMVNKPFRAFQSVLDFLNIQATHSEITDAINNSSFEILQDQEKQKGFTEKNIKSRVFFRNGAVDSWKKCLKESEIKRITNHHQTVMKDYGYL